jgi:dynein heavy chain
MLSVVAVSRAGMVYVDVNDLGWQPYVTSWINRTFNPPALPGQPPQPVGPELDMMTTLFAKYVPKLLRFRKKECKELVPSGEFNSIISLCNLFAAIYSGDNGLGKLHNDAPGYATFFERWFAYCCVWSIGATLDENSRRRFNDCMREVEPIFPPVGTVYDYWVDPAGREFKAWSDKLSNSWRPPKDAAFSKIIVPTIDTLRNSYLISALVAKGNHVMIVGNTGTGKSVLAQQQLELLPNDEFSKMTLYFSAATTSNTVQEVIEAGLEKRSKNKLGPPSGKRLVLLVDDLNMPKKDTFGSQPPLELLRQWIDYGGWYDRQKQMWRFVIDMQLITAMGPPGGGRNVISERLQSRFNMINFTFPAEKQIKTIYESILTPKLWDFNEDVKRLAPGIVSATVQVYEKVVELFLPTPQNSHYLFNLRDIGKVIQGVLQANGRDFDTKDVYLKLWVHEMLRTFADRFTSYDDIAKFRGLLDTALHKTFEGTYLKNLVEGCENTELGPVYADFVQGAPTKSGSSGEGESLPFVEISNLDKLRATIEEEMIEYNSTPGLIPMNLVLFRDALRHVARIARMLRTARGNALLVGVGGSGRQSLAKIAAFVTKDALGNRMGVFSIEITKQYRMSEFHEDIKKLYARTGIDGKPTMFLFTDTQIKDEGFLEDVNNILSSGEVPNLYNKDEKIGVLDAIRPIAKKLSLGQSNDELWNLFIERVRHNLHVVLCMSPVGDAFRNRTRMYPSLVNCTTIDWFHEWPLDALREVATKFLEEVKFAAPGAMEGEEAALKTKIASVFAAAHKSVTDASGKMLLQLKRYNYVTPTHYLELVLGYRSLLAEKKRELGDARNKLANGLAKLESSKEQVIEMQADLALKQKVVEKASAECDALLVKIVQEKRLADEQRAEVEEASMKIGLEEAKCKEIADDAEADLAEAMPALERAMGEVDKLDSTAISEVKAYKKPPDVVLTVLGAVMTLMGVPTDWASAQAKIGESGFLRQVKTYDKDNVPGSTLKKLKKYTEKAEFDPDIVRKSSSAAAALATWVLAIELYSAVAKEVEPKRNALRAAEALLAEKQEQLAKAKNQLALVIAKVDQLNAQHIKSVTEKTALQLEAATLQDKLERAEKLINGLSGERVRWEQSILNYDVSLHNLTGDALVAAAFLSYAGPFDTNYRDTLVQGWLLRVRENAIPFSEDFNFATFLSDPSDVRDWNIQGLPTDQFSTENGVIVTRGRRWPLMIDPQGQANKWIKEKEKARGLKITDLKAKDFLRELEQAITYGLPYILQDVEEDLDPALEPVLTKSLIKRGTREVLRLGDKELDWNKDFRLYITTKLANPHYTPEVSTKVTLVNFSVKEQGLEAQLLGIVVQMEEPKLESQKSELVMTVATGKRKLVELENTILRLLSEAKGSLLDDQHLVDTLQISKATSEEVASALKVAEETEAKIDIARAGYRPISTRASLLFFVLNDLSSVDPMYQFSLDAYTLLFRGSIADSKAATAKAKAASLGFDDEDRSAEEQLRQRIMSVNDWHTYEVCARPDNASITSYLSFIDACYCVAGVQVCVPRSI